MVQTITWFRQQLQRFGLESLNRYYGLYRAFVVDNNDPDKLNRLKLEIPQIYGKEVHNYWAWSAGTYSGTGVGFVAVPHVGEMVWGSFENGDPTYPIWLYGHFGSGDMVKEAESDYPNKKVLQTHAGNRLVFDDNKKEVHLRQADGTAIGIANGKIYLGKETSAAQPVTLGDTTQNQLESICSQIESLCDQIALITVNAAGVPTTVPINAPAFTIIKAQVTAIKSSLSNIKSTKVRTD